MDSNYAAIIDINSLTEILDNGWLLYRNEALFPNVTNFIETMNTKNLKTFSMTGEFSVGKTWVINQLAQSGLNSSDVVHTVGISIYKRDDIVFLDTAGSGNPVFNKEPFILDRRMTDFFIESVVKDVS